MKLSFDTMSPREQRLVKIGAVAAVAILIFGVLIPLDSSVTKARARVTQKQADLLWRAALKGAADLSRKHTSTPGCRSLDVLHVASAIELQFKQFTTFDSRQQQLAKAAGLKLVTPTV